MLIAYLKDADPYSVRMKAFLTRRNIEFEQRDASDLPAGLQAPQLFKDEVCIGDLERVSSLELQGILDEVLREDHPL